MKIEVLSDPAIGYWQSVTATEGFLFRTQVGFVNTETESTYDKTNQELDW